MLSLLLALHTTFNYAFNSAGPLQSTPQQNFLVHVKGSLCSGMSFQEERRHIHLMLCFTMGKVHKWESSLNVGPKSATCLLGPLFCKCPHSPALPYTPYSILLFFSFFKRNSKPHKIGPILQTHQRNTHLHYTQLVGLVCNQSITTPQCFHFWSNAFWFLCSGLSFPPTFNLALLFSLTIGTNSTTNPSRFMSPRTHQCTSHLETCYEP